MKIFSPGKTLGILLLAIGISFREVKIIWNFISIIYPAWMSIFAIESGIRKEKQGWICYWIVFALFQLFEKLFFFIIYMIPFYSFFRMIFFLYLLLPLPKVQGAVILSEHVLQPFLEI